jgi:hypothetical protein
MTPAELDLVARHLFLGQHTNAKRNAERRLCAQMGGRQYRKVVKAGRRADKLAREARRAQMLDLTGELELIRLGG